ncbi:hypothetical protein BEWA_045760 [Theileria equi strain WA]|uniref:Signal peptide containing protein n=1 Tax=Theileria equi strain WA TaxID=1537102 RepID=L1L9L5_THEEQ|nr:hypothetical protein BEWA_045760 [Theileria equi strain WA]EKX72112.1 hypothetical protein BEWA_045760 [Theileria equi strain WA]|eukprot:XP_004831564.1 hypothetical protein BEWA_045760 [Theileria equi strain WA]
MDPLPVFYLVCIVAIKESVCTTSAISFDLSNPDVTHIDLIKQIYSEIEHRQYIQRDGHYIGSVVDNSLEIWKAGEHDICSAVNLYSKDDKRFLVLQILNGGSTDLHFEKTGEKWQKISLESLRDVQEQKSDANVLDIVRPDGSRVNSGKITGNGLIRETFVPDFSTNITLVSHSGSEIWRSSKGEKCILAKLSSKNGYFLFLIYTSTRGCVEQHFYERKDHGWSEIERDDYYGKLDEMKDVAAKA